MELHHIGAIVDSIDDACLYYGALYNKTFTANKIFISSQGVNVCFIEIAPGVLLELIEEVNEGSAIRKLKSKGFTFYHLGYLVEEFDNTISNLTEKNFKYLSTFNSEAFRNKRCAFLYSPEMHLIEIIEK